MANANRLPIWYQKYDPDETIRDSRPLIMVKLRVRAPLCEMPTRWNPNSFAKLKRCLFVMNCIVGLFGWAVTVAFVSANCGMLPTASSLTITLLRLDPSWIVTVLKPANSRSIRRLTASIACSGKFTVTCWLTITDDFNFTAPIAETDLFRTRLADWCGPIAYAHCNTCKVALFMRDMLTWRDFRQTLISQVSCTALRNGTGRRSCETCWTEPNRISRQSLTADMHHLLTFHFRRTMARKGKIRRGLSD